MNLSVDEVEKLKGQKQPLVAANLSSSEAAVLWANIPWRNRLICVWISIVIFPPVAVIELIFFKIYRWDRKTQQVVRVGWKSKPALTALALFACAITISGIIKDYQNH